ncbi:Zn-dependent oxidoreductase [Labrys wisconsinensis]|uniref:L-gulonate 5-dehydrogenase n=1 Tax=Labrys wisconsinensis TaxID=425677 RepID=A0ABU0JG42_9HYPH|nr:Zn-dependent oxidoreductase [Labrys wisconsinensis]MDQ0473261.1 L-gulonate 5-dehydrogenase [Labrys wisconsinensis]
MTAGDFAMIAVAVEEPHRLVVRADAAAPPGPGEVAIRIARAGICGSDMHILHGTNPFAVYPRIIGHEFAGVVEAVGEGVAGPAPGDHVVGDPVIACGHCYPCRVGRPNVCARLEVLGVHRDGGFRSRVVIPAANAVKVPPALPLAIAALAEPFSVAANVLGRTGCGPQDTVLVYGAGTVGLTVLQVARLHGARVIVADIDAARLELAQALGADRVVHSRREPVPAAVAAENEGLGPSLVIDGAGIPSLLAEAVAVASPAGRIGLLGFAAEPSALVQQEVVRKELSIFGSRLNRRLIPEVVGWLASGRLDPGAMITRTFAAAEARAAFDLLETDPGRAVKVQLAFDA